MNEQRKGAKKNARRGKQIRNLVIISFSIFINISLLHKVCEPPRRTRSSAIISCNCGVIERSNFDKGITCGINQLQNSNCVLVRLEVVLNHAFAHVRKRLDELIFECDVFLLRINKTTNPFIVVVPAFVSYS
jgi:hypothetical protein